MPYKIVKKGDKFCVLKKDTGENTGCSANEHDAIAHMRVMYAAESGTKMTGKPGKAFKVRTKTKK